jgi:hypothetical protein
LQDGSYNCHLLCSKWSQLNVEIIIDLGLREVSSCNIYDCMLYLYATGACSKTVLLNKTHDVTTVEEIPTIIHSLYYVRQQVFLYSLHIRKAPS